MSPGLAEFLIVDAAPLAAAVMAAVSCGVLGNFLVLRRQSMLGDAISHAVLPGIVVGFLLADTRTGWAILLGAAGAGLAAVLLVEAVRRLGRVDAGAAMGVVFTVMFALGVVMMERAAARHVDLDADCVLYGQLESLSWPLSAELAARPWSLQALDLLPPELGLLAGSLVLVVLFVSVLFKELRVVSFDPQLATSLGVNASWTGYAISVLTAVVTVASFRAVGSILVVAMLITPACAARMLTDRLSVQVWLSAAAALVVAVGGYLTGAWGAPAVGLRGSVNIAGSMAVVGGLLVALAAVASPSHGWIARAARRRRLGLRIGVEDLLGVLYRLEEHGRAAADAGVLRGAMGGASAAGRARRRAGREGLVRASGSGVTLTPAGRERAAGVIRSHRLWETYLVHELGMRPDHVHEPAERLEHARTPKGEPIAPPRGDTTDPHGHPIPPGP